uniref:Uncharacterized protein n=1 Tax=Spongospora subterranea TaxID=70186 RepID=A0A0H5QSG1_9EUKA|eukprot:CRZ04973.1 hypothetical protein [Spongospora subterranea]
MSKYLTECGNPLDAKSESLRQPKNLKKLSTISVTSFSPTSYNRTFIPSEVVQIENPKSYGFLVTKNTKMRNILPFTTSSLAWVVQLRHRCWKIQIQQMLLSSLPR